MNDNEGQIERLSFGCSNLLGDKTAEAGVSLLNAAYDAGIRNYDVARVYNFGDAEALLGQFATGKRQQLQITTKFGLMPNKNVAKMGNIIQFARRVMRASSFVRKLVRRNVGRLTQAGRFDRATAQASLEASLTALRTDYIDVLLLHEATETDCTDELFGFLEEVQRQGKVLAFGVGSEYAKIREIAQHRPRFLQVAQFDSSVSNKNRASFEDLRPPENQLVITHGSFSGAHELLAELAGKPQAIKSWSDSAGMDLGDPSIFHGALLRCALRANPGGRVIFRASSPQKIRENLQVVGGSMSDAQLNAVEDRFRGQKTNAEQSDRTQT